MATAKVNKPEEVEDNRVEVFVPRGAQNDDQGLYVSVNGMKGGYLLPKGEKSKVPPEIAFEIARAEIAQNALDRKMRAMANN